MGWSEIAGIAVAGLLIWLLISTIKRSPSTFSAANFSKSFTTMGILALILIGFIGFCVLLLRSH